MNSEKSPKASEMSDALVAKGIIADTFDLTPGRRSIVIGLAIAALKRVERALPAEVLRARKRQWTERRVRSIVDEEARRIDAYEIEDLKRVAVAEARHDYRKSTERAARLAAFLAHQDPDFHSEEIAFQSAMARGLAGAGNPMAHGATGEARTGADRGRQLPGGVAGARNRGGRE